MVIGRSLADATVGVGLRTSIGNGGKESACGWCKDTWGLNWQITPRMLTEAMAPGGAEAKRAFVRR